MTQTPATATETNLSDLMTTLFPPAPAAEPVDAVTAGYVPPVSDAEPLSPAEFAAWSAPWLEMSRRIEDAKLARRGGRRLTAEEIASRLRASEEITASLATA